jgi:hypothetical protein
MNLGIRVSIREPESILRGNCQFEEHETALSGKFLDGNPIER